MQITIILQIITVAITIITLITDCIYTITVNRKRRTFNTVGREMINKLDLFRDAYAKVMSLTYDRVIDSRRNFNSKPCFQNSAYAYDLNLARSRVRTFSLPFWDKEKNLHITLDKLCKLALKYYENPTEEDKQELRRLRDDFFIECSIYDWAMWEFNQLQVAGNKIGRREMDRYYYTILTRIHNSGSGQSLKFKEAFAEIYKRYMMQKKRGIRFQKMKEKNVEE